MLTLFFCTLALFQGPDIAQTSPDMKRAFWAEVDAEWVELSPGIWEKSNGTQTVRFLSGQEGFSAALAEVEDQLAALAWKTTGDGALRREKLLAREARLHQILQGEGLPALDPRDKAVVHSLAGTGIEANAMPQSGRARAFYQGPCRGAWYISVDLSIDGQAVGYVREGEGASFDVTRTNSMEGCGRDCRARVFVSLEGCDSLGRPFLISTTAQDNTCNPVPGIGVSARATTRVTQYNVTTFEVRAFVLGGCGDTTYAWKWGPNVVSFNGADQPTHIVRLEGRGGSYADVTVTDKTGQSRTARVYLVHGGETLPPREL
ncbi:hypothetical protein [Acanthopleuribacter pedis]|uniref:PKD domain-containing protein n=1 Tax=Acanthopleuribacter pedis TaxID=442870 RepID=A0A8J7QLW8_9BACT|nr:hypothetical protein [Acanthopleuribacter pedis]MBO1320738.1 hypothetical protein [Acanthopleuribacter pedis]